ncbi:MAG: GntR family transcriptional regulator [Sphingobium sp.]
MKSAKMAQRLAEEIEQDIVRNHSAGDHLGTETVLMERYGVSRSILREALMLVAVTGLGEIRRGHSGGLFASTPSLATVAASLQASFSAAADDPLELNRTRHALEDVMLILAVDRFERERIGDALALIARLEGAVRRNARMALASDVIHLIAQQCGNPFIAVVVLALTSIAIDGLTRQRSDPEAMMALGDRMLELRFEQLRAVLAGDAGRALVANAQLHETHVAHRALPPIAAADDRAAAGDGRPIVAPFGVGQCEKLAEVVARRIRNRIAGERLDEGAYLGSEAELMLRYGVSRAVFREAVRLLERHALVRMARGKHGGLRVHVPTPDAVVTASVLSLRNLRIEERHVHEFGSAFGLIVVERLAADPVRRSAPQVGELLRSLIVVRDVPLSELARAHFEMLTGLCGGQALQTLGRILARFEGSGIEPAGEVATVREVLAAPVEDLIAAIASGDTALARRRMMIVQRSGARVRMRPR